MYKEDLALNSLQWLICHKTQPNQKKSCTRCIEWAVNIDKTVGYFPKQSVGSPDPIPAISVIDFFW